MKETFWTMLRDGVHRRETYSRAEFWDRRAEAMTADEACLWRILQVKRRDHREHWAFLRSVVPSLEGKRVLDLGWGTGRFCRELTRGGARVTRVVLDTGFLRRFKRRGWHVQVSRPLHCGAGPAGNGLSSVGSGRDRMVSGLGRSLVTRFSLAVLGRRRGSCCCLQSIRRVGDRRGTVRGLMSSGQLDGATHHAFCAS